MTCNPPGSAGRVSNVRSSLSPSWVLNRPSSTSDYFADGTEPGSALEHYDLVWLRGGNVFMLRYALRRSRADALLVDALKRDALVYAGYSAGPCVLAPSLRGLEAVDDATAVARIHGNEPPS